MALLTRPANVLKNVAATFVIDYDALAALSAVPSGFYKNTSNWKNVFVKVKHKTSGQNNVVQFTLPSTNGTLLVSDSARAGSWEIISFLIRDFDRGEIVIEKANIPDQASFDFNVVSAASHGDLIVPAGQTISIPTNGFRQYGDLIVETGGTLKLDDGGGIVEIEVLGNCVINGTILAKQGKHTGGTWSRTSTLAESLVHSVTQKAGGAGGDGEAEGANPGGTGGAAAFGNGAGGGRSAKFIAENGQSASTIAAGMGAGASVAADEYGEAGLAADIPSHAAGGGFRGAHGQAIYIKANKIQGSGTIDASGQNGGNGGNGAEFLSGGEMFGNGAGGGAAGGEGGNVWLRAKKGTPVLTVNVLGGERGSRGATAPGATDAEHGQAGSNGTYSFSLF
jgi:hypothetical protein